MDNKKIGEYITTLRKNKNLTQKDLADKLGITDKAVSKWERGAGFPDIGMLRPLADLLDTTVNELLDGEPADQTNKSGAKDLANALEYADKIITIKENKLGKLLASILTICLASGIFASIIVNFSISHRLTWSILVIDGCLLGGLLLIPPMIYKARGLFYSFVLLNLLIMPFLAVIQTVTSDDGITSGWLWRLGFPIAATWLSIGWIMIYLFMKGRINLWFYTCIGVTLCIPGHLITNYVVDRYMHNLNDIFSRQITAVSTTFGLLSIAFITLVVGLYRRKLKQSNTITK